METSGINKILVLGSNSFTGSHFIDYVLEQREQRGVEVIGVSRSKEYDPLFLPYLYQKSRSPRFRFFPIDLNTEWPKLSGLINQEKPDVIVNYAAQGEVRNSWLYPEQWFETNCLGVVRLAHFLSDKPYLRRYVHISTPEVYGSTRERIRENFTFYPSTPYAASKLAGELFLLALFKKQRFPVVMTRSANVYGKHQQLYRIIPRTIIYLKQGKKIPLHGGGNQARNFVHVRDIAAATWKIMQRGKDGEVYHLAGEEREITIKDLVRLICERTGYEFTSSIKIGGENFGQDGLYSLDCTKMQREIGWKPDIMFTTGLGEVIAWIEDHWQEIQQQPLEYIHKA